jgi:hypothetical protein
MTPSTSHLDLLVGKRLSMVVFVADYVQFEFGGPRLTALVWPRVQTSGGVKRAADPGYRDALCSLIFRTVTDVSEDSDQGLVVRFDSEALTINPEPGELQGPEIALLGEDDFLMVWRPGEDCFTDRDW